MKLMETHIEVPGVCKSKIALANDATVEATVAEFTRELSKVKFLLMLICIGYR